MIAIIDKFLNWLVYLQETYTTAELLIMTFLWWLGLTLLGITICLYIDIERGDI